jgi:AraC-like DNA-binding protein
MDLLSEVLSLLKPRSYITGGFDAGDPWALCLDDLAGRIKCYAVMQGACWLAMDGIEAPVRLQEGDCLVLPSGRSVIIASDPGLSPKLASEVLDPTRNGQVVTYNGGGDVFLVGSRFDIAGRHAEALLRTLPPIIRVQTGSGQAKLRWSIELMMEELRDAQPGSSLVAQQLSHMMLVQALRLYLADGPRHDRGWFAALADPQLGAAISAMHARPSAPWTLQTLSRHAGMSRSGFAQQFRERVGETPMAYLTRWRMMLAVERLTGGRETIARIATSLGYESEHAFNTAFSRVMGTSPRRYANALSARDGRATADRA